MKPGVPGWQSVLSTGEPLPPGLYANHGHGFSFHATVRGGADQRKELFCLDISHLGPMHGPKTPQQNRHFHQSVGRSIAD